MKYEVPEREVFFWLEGGMKKEMRDKDEQTLR